MPKILASFTPPVLREVRVTQPSFLCSFLLITSCPFDPFRLAIVLSVHLQFTASDNHFDIFKLFLHIT